MGIVYPVFPSYPVFEYAVDIGDSSYRFRFSWNERSHSWYFDLQDPDGNDIASGRRVSPDNGPLVGLLPVDAPRDVYIYVQGIDPYEREHIGERVFVIIYDADELPDVSDPTSPVTLSAVP